MSDQPTPGAAVPLARTRAETHTQGSLTVKSKSFSDEIPRRYSEYADGVSPEISWTPVEGAKSYALILEDPDAKKVRPFVHWVAWNIPADLTAVPEGLQGLAQLTESEGLLQGKTSGGSIGYFGPRPPAGDPPHHYHFQVFALDTVLDAPPGVERDVVLAAMKGHVLASGELIGTYQG